MVKSIYILIFSDDTNTGDSVNWNEGIEPIPSYIYNNSHKNRHLNTIKINKSEGKCDYLVIFIDSIWSISSYKSSDNDKVETEGVWNKNANIGKMKNDYVSSSLYKNKFYNSSLSKKPCFTYDVRQIRHQSKALSRYK